MPGYFWQDDYYITAWAQANPLNGWYLFLPFSDHFQPLGFGLAWISQRLFPGSYTAAMLWTALVYAASIWVFYRLLIQLYGWRTQFYLVLLLWSFSVFTVQSFLWYAASLYLAPYLLIVPLALLATVKYLDDPQWWRLVVVFCVSSLAVLAHTFGFVVPVLSAVLIAVMRLGSDSNSAWWLALRRQWLLLLVQVLPSILTVVFYLQRSASGRGVTLDPIASFLFVVREFIWVVIPGMVGGPWRYNGFLSPEFPLFTALGGFAVVQFVVFVALLAKFKPRAFALWIGAIVIISGQLGAVTLGRGGGETALVVRYAAPGLIALALAVSYSMASRPHEVTPWRSVGADVALMWRRFTPVAKGVVVLALGQIYLVSFSVSVFTPAFESPFALNRMYMEELIGSSKSIPVGTALLPQFVPNRVVGINAPGPTSTQLVLANQSSPPLFADSVTGVLWGFTDEGDLVEQTVWGVETAGATDQDCVARVTGDPVTLQLVQPAEYGYATIAIGTLAQSQVDLDIELMSDEAVVGSTVVAVAAGLNRSFSGLAGEGDSVRISPRGDALICITDIVVGERFHLQDGGWTQDGSSLPTQSFRLGPGD